VTGEAYPSGAPDFRDLRRPCGHGYGAASLPRSPDVRLIASAQDLSFRSGRGSCVIDDYTTSKATYREIACLASGPGSSAVVVAAAPIGLWHQQAAILERAVSSFVP